MALIVRRRTAEKENSSPRCIGADVVARGE
jgi:hypothetical protein